LQTSVANVDQLQNSIQLSPCTVKAKHPPKFDWISSRYDCICAVPLKDMEIHSPRRYLEYRVRYATPAKQDVPLLLVKTGLCKTGYQQHM